MKKTLLALFNLITILVFILILFTLYGKAIRQVEIDNALESSMKYAMELLLFEEGHPETTEEWEEKFIESLVVQIESNSDLTVHVYEMDLEKGLLSAECILTFRHPIGTTGTVTTGKRTILLEEYIYENK